MLWSALEGGSTLDATTVSQRLGIDKPAAKKLIELLSTAKGANDDYLPLYSEDENMETGVALTNRTTADALPIRLTDPELNALYLALDTLGVTQDDPLRQKLAEASDIDNDSLPDESEVAKTLSTAYASPSGDALLLISEALAQSRDLSFEYQGSFDQSPLRRHATPHQIHHDDRLWYLEAYDLERRGERTFRVDRMSHVATVSRHSEAPSHEETSSAGRPVTLRFLGRSHLLKLDWPGLKVLQDDGDCITSLVPYYDGTSTWLERRITACAGKVTTTDPVLRKRVCAYALALRRKGEGQSVT